MIAGVYDQYVGPGFDFEAVHVSDETEARVPHDLICSVLAKLG